ncbi:MAG: hypothetical protein P1V51_18530 [Deltaproteobacteria bacterium]|nr:hypothetical protein [Deltaproteobacteria bacterium]
MMPSLARLAPLALLLGAALLVSACPSSRPPRGGQQSPQKAVVARLDALQDQDAQRMVELSPPGLDEKQREELRIDLGGRLGAYQRLPDTPFALSEPQGDDATARITLGRRTGGGTVELVLELEQVGSKWYVKPPRIDEVPAG